jgi:hypothetical protein
MNCRPMVSSITIRVGRAVLLYRLLGLDVVSRRNRHSQSLGNEARHPGVWSGVTSRLLT